MHYKVSQFKPKVIWTDVTGLLKWEGYHSKINNLDLYVINLKSENLLYPWITIILKDNHIVYYSMYHNKKVALSRIEMKAQFYSER